ncbi:uncharacterized protein MONBRDRAFT_8368 [Monosiga brevicollis MX1]|uniref:SMC hinge domain-containing protein n=1 Tax=Monosiga brevicollis TaxID=81824 RepID=A9UZV5_MONBE|nr:uncharacterized protein MONBRDRAFT_8368 [Monosiga brevicollis MX1]EDQ89431.1 predicted protein [Monosiga brevicollis MX1]|eukprot:XP_001746007.1 hypothetical protein [Monosiga brevicollis MX1]
MTTVNWTPPTQASPVTYQRSMLALSAPTAASGSPSSGGGGLSQGTQKALKVVLAGVAGLIGVGITYPLDMAKTRLQAQLRGQASASGRPHYRGMLHCIWTVAKTEGRTGVYRGLSVNLMGVFPEKAVKLSVNDFARTYLADEHGNVSTLSGCFAGALAGLCQSPITNPMELVKVQRMTAMAAKKTGGGTGQVETLSQMLKRLGFRGVYTGYTSTIMRDIPFSILFFWSYGALNDSWARPYPGAEPDTRKSFVAGLFCGCVAAVLSTPMDVIKTNLQLKDTEHKSIRAVARNVYANYGLGGFFNGASLAVTGTKGQAQISYCHSDSDHNHLIGVSMRCSQTVSHLKRILRMETPGRPRTQAASAVPPRSGTSADGPSFNFQPHVQVGAFEVPLGDDTSPLVNRFMESFSSAVNAFARDVVSPENPASATENPRWHTYGENDYPTAGYDSEEDDDGPPGRLVTEMLHASVAMDTDTPAFRASAIAARARVVGTLSQQLRTQLGLLAEDLSLAREGDEDLSPFLPNLDVERTLRGVNAANSELESLESVRSLNLRPLHRPWPPPTSPHHLFVMNALVAGCGCYKARPAEYTSTHSARTHSGMYLLLSKSFVTALTHLMPRHSFGNRVQLDVERMRLCRKIVQSREEVSHLLAELGRIEEEYQHTLVERVRLSQVADSAPESYEMSLERRFETENERSLHLRNVYAALVPEEAPPALLETFGPLGGRPTTGRSGAALRLATQLFESAVAAEDQAERLPHPLGAFQTQHRRTLCTPLVHIAHAYPVRRLAAQSFGYDNDGDVAYNVGIIASAMFLGRTIASYPTNPYFLPSLICTVLCGAAFVPSYLYLPETLPKGLHAPGASHGSDEEDVEAATAPLMPAQSEVVDKIKSGTWPSSDAASERPLSARELLKQREVVLLILLYGVYAIAAIGMEEIHSVFCATSVELGGLGWDTTTIGTSLGLIGVILMFMQTMVFPQLEKRLKLVKTTAVGCALATFFILWYPPLNTLATNARALPLGVDPRPSDELLSEEGKHVDGTLYLATAVVAVAYRVFGGCVFCGITLLFNNSVHAVNRYDPSSLVSRKDYQTESTKRTARSCNTPAVFCFLREPRDTCWDCNRQERRRWRQGRGDCIHCAWTKQSSSIGRALVTIKGFKSYRDQTFVEPFSPHHNVIVGRNGSGKSNFFFAIRFVLSDMFSSMRAPERRALLHEGAGRAVVDAYVEIVFDNSDGRIPIDKEEVVLRRNFGLKKDEYYLNNSRSTKNEVCLLSRLVAFGIERRHLALTVSMPLRQVVNLLESANFSRSNPYYIVQQGKINDLATASDSARLDLLKEVAGTNVYDERRKESLKILEDANNKRDRIEEVLKDIDTRLEELESEQSELKAYQQLDTDKRAIEYAIYSKELRDTNDQLAALEQHREELSSHLRSEDGNATDLQEELTTREQQLEENKQELADLQTDRTTIETERAQLLRTVAGLQVDVEELQSSASMEKGRYGEIAKDMQHLRSEIQRVEGQLAELAGPYEEVTAQREQHEKLLAINEQKRDALLAKQSRHAQYQTKEDRDAFLREELASVTKAKQGKQENRLELQKDIERHLRTVTELGLRVVRDLTERMQVAGVYGPVIDLINVDEDVATQLLQEMNRLKLPGRVTFLPLSKLRPKQFTYPETSDAVPLLSRVQADERFSAALQHIFGRTLVCRDLSVASSFSKEGTFDAITLQGDRVSRKGAFTGGFVKTKASKLRLQAEIHESRDELERLTRRQDELKDAEAKVEQQTTLLLTEMHKAENELKQFRTNVHHLQGDVDQMTRSIEENKRQADIKRKHHEVADMIEQTREQLHVCIQQQSGTVPLPVSKKHEICNATDIAADQLSPPRAVYME